MKDQTTRNPTRETARNGSRSHRTSWNTRKRAHDHGPNTSRIHPVDIGSIRTKVNSLTNLVDQREAFMERPVKASGSHAKIRFDTISQDRSTGEEALRLYALVDRSSNWNCPRQREWSDMEMGSLQARKAPAIGTGTQRQVHVQRAAPAFSNSPLHSKINDDHDTQQPRTAPVSHDHLNLPFGCKYSEHAFVPVHPLTH